jgi:hypothetical protein
VLDNGVCIDMLWCVVVVWIYLSIMVMRTSNALTRGRGGIIIVS